jgi:hypothetical protein
MSEMQSNERRMTAEEERLVRWMLEHGDPEAKPFLQQLELVRVTAWRCKCGCASINFMVEGHTTQSVGLHPIADFVFGDDGEESGIFVYEKGGVLAGLEVYGMSGEAPKSLPVPESLRPFPPNTTRKPT